MGSAGRTAGRDGTRLINKLSLALRRRRLSEGLGERVGRLLSCLSRQARASRDPAPLRCPACLLALLDDALVGLCADCLGVGSLRRRLRSMATVGASSAAIFATAMSASGKAGALVSSDAVAAASFAGDKASSVVATLVSSAAASA
jgi:hypothetical protein